MTDEYRVFGPPGTGKTSTLSTWIAQAAERYGEDSILVASFTKAAATELGRRDLPLDASHIGTLHALCYHSLGSPTIAEVKVAEFNDAQTHYRLSDAGRTLDEPDPVFSSDSDRIMAQYQTLRATLTRREAWPLEVTAFATAWERWKNNAGYIDFTDMIELVLTEGIDPPFGTSIGFFDEVQDFTPLELALVRHWRDAMDFIVLAGDDDQCIYSFKGASPDAFLNPPVDDDHKRILRQSYRIPAAVHRLSQDWISRAKFREDKVFSPRDVEGVVERRDDLTYRYAAEALARELDGQQDVMVIASCSYQVAPIVRALRDAGIPFHNPYRKARGDWNPIRGGGRGTATTERITALLARDWTYGQVSKWLPLVKQRGVLTSGRWRDAVAEQPPERRVSEAQLQQMFEPGVVDAIRNDPLGWLPSHVYADKASAIEFPLRLIKRYGLAALRQTPQVVVGTIHSVKGAEADSVYLFPDLSPQGYEQHERGDDSVRRMMYVGMTRARNRLVICGQSTSQAVRL